jgi:hypothetical protein
MLGSDLKIWCAQVDSSHACRSANRCRKVAVSSARFGFIRKVVLQRLRIRSVRLELVIDRKFFEPLFRSAPDDLIHGASGHICVALYVLPQFRLGWRRLKGGESLTLSLYCIRHVEWDIVDVFRNFILFWGVL